MEHPLIRVLGDPERFWLAKHPRLFTLWEYSHRRDARLGCNARWINTVSSVRMFWYEFNGFLYLEKMFDNFFSPAKMLEMSPGEWWVVVG
jgi:hypothetical protein